MYRNQHGCISGGKTFDIQRRVRQGDVIRPLPFKAALEHALRKWKRKLAGHGFLLGGTERLINIKHADDIMVYAKSMDELVDMLELLYPELASVGLELNVAKTKILTNANLETLCFAEVAAEFTEILQGEQTHRYLGRNLVGDLALRTNVEFDPRLRAAWAKFHKDKHVILTKHASLKLRLKLFDSVVSTTAIFGLAVLPLTKIQIHKLDFVQQKMLRSIVGWVRTDSEHWQDTMRRMNGRLDFAMTLFRARRWSDRFSILAIHLTQQMQAWPAALWHPTAGWNQNFDNKPFRKRGRPTQRCDDQLGQFAAKHVDDEDHWLLIAARNSSSERAYVEICRNQVPLSFWDRRQFELTRTGERKKGWLAFVCRNIFYGILVTTPYINALNLYECHAPSFVTHVLSLQLIVP